jgi:flavin-dependent dehydrogenase
MAVNSESICVSVNLKNTPQQIVASWVIAADGMWSPVRKSLGLSESGYLGEWHAFRQYANNVTGVANERLIVWFEKDLLPGYAWSFPLPNNRVNIGFGVVRDGKRRIQDMKDVWTDLLRRPHIVEALGPEFVMEDRHTAWPIPARVDEAVTGSGRVLFVGDAAMATDTLTGEGIGQALLSGSLAAEAIIQGGLPVEVRNTYAQAVKLHLFADHRMSLRLSKILAHGRGARGAIAIVSKSGNWGKRNFARWMFEDEPRAIAFTPKRWHRKMFRLKGPYQS